MGLREIRIEFYRFLRGGPRVLLGFMCRHGAVFPQQAVGIRQPHVCLGVSRIVDDGLCEVIDRCVEVGWSLLFEIEAALEAKLRTSSRL
jgi:hypothetical protein